MTSTAPLSDQQLASIEAGRAAVRAKLSGGAFPAALGQAIADELAEAAMAPVLAEATHRLKVANRSHLATLAGCCVMLGLPKDTAEPDVFEAIRRLRVESEQRLGELLFWEFEYRAAMDNYKGENWQVGQLRAELEQAREARLEWSRIGDHPELANWADSLVSADLTPHPAFAWNSTTTGYEVAAQIATTDRLTDSARQLLLTELQAAFTETVCRVLHRSLATPAETVHQAGCDAVTEADQ